MIKIYKNSFVFAILFFTTISYSQYKLTIKNPDSLKGEYALTFGNLGTAHINEISGELFLQTGLACDTVVSAEAKDKIVLIDRGTCAFDVKLLGAVKAGAKACIICNNAATAPIVIAGSLQQPIPVYMASLADCNIIKANLAKSTLAAGITRLPCPNEREYSGDVFWGNKPGEGDFSNGLGNWESVSLTDNPDRKWVYNPVALPLFGAFNGNGVSMTSPTACNGVATISFASFSFVDNPSLQRPYPIYTSELISPTVSCIGKSGVSVEFYQVINRLNRNLFYSISTDGGNTWTERIQIPTQNVVNELPKTELRSLPIPQFDNQANCKFKFIAEGDFYYYSIDDFVFTTKKIYDVKINRDWYAGGPNFATPFNQTYPFPLIVDIENLGNQILTNTKVVANVTRVSDNSLVYSDTLSYPDFPATTKFENTVFKKLVSLPQEIGNYTLSYTVMADSTLPGAETTFSTPIELSKNVFTKLPIPDPGTSGVLRGWRAGNSTNFFTAASHYYMPKGTWPNNAPITIDKAFTGAVVNPSNPNATTAAILSVDVYEWTKAKTDSIVRPQDRKLIATGTKIIENSTPSTEIELFDPTDAEKKVVLNNKGDLHLIVATSVSPVDDANTTWFMSSRNPADIRESSGQFNSFATSFAASAFDGGITHNCFFGSSSGDTPDSRNLERTSLVIYNPLILKEVDLTSVNFVDKNAELNISPNPAVDFTQIDIKFDGQREYVNLLITDISGRIVHAEKYVNIDSKVIRVNTAQFTAGIYNLNITTEKGFVNKQISVVK